MRPTRIHHINFIVRDLAEAEGHFRRLFGLPEFETVDHALQGSQVSRVKIGESWLVLVCPYDEESVPGRFLDKNGEGFFLLSLGVQDLQKQVDNMQFESQVRDGILDWKVADVGEAYGALMQLTEDRPL